MKIRITAWILLFCFTATTIGWSAPASSVASNEFRVTSQRNNPELRVPLLAESVEIPETIGKIGERYVPSRDSLPATRYLPAIIHIQDAHSNYEAQVHIKEILNHLKKDYGLDLVFVEGSIHGLDPALLEFFKSPELNQKAADLLAREGIASGAELFLLDSVIASEAKQSQRLLRQPDGLLAMTNSKIPTVYGVEDRGLYGKNLAAFRSVLKQKEKSKKFLESLKSNLLTGSSKVFNKRLKAFFEQWLFFENHRGEIVRHLDLLQKYALADLKLDLRDAKNQLAWPQLVRFFKLRELENKIDTKKAEEERQKLIAWTKEQKLGEEYEKGIREFNSNKSLRGFLEHFFEAASRKSFSFKQYPHFSRAAGLSILKSELQADDLFNEIHKLTETLLETLAKKENEKTLIRAYKDYGLLAKLLLLELTREEYRQVILRKEEIKPSALVERFELIQGQVPRGKGQKTVNEQQPLDPRPLTLDPLFNHALNFYSLAQKRESVMFDKMLSKMKELGKANAVLITGGFHSEGLFEDFKQKGISYVEVTPHISEVTGNQTYLNAMFGSADYLTLRSYLSPTHIAEEGGLAELSKFDSTTALQDARMLNLVLVSASREKVVTEAAAQKKSPFELFQNKLNGALPKHGLVYTPAGELFLLAQSTGVGINSDIVPLAFPSKSSRSEVRTEEQDEKIKNKITKIWRQMGLFAPIHLNNRNQLIGQLEPFGILGSADDDREGRAIHLTSSASRRKDRAVTFHLLWDRPLAVAQTVRLARMKEGEKQGVVIKSEEIRKENPVALFKVETTFNEPTDMIQTEVIQELPKSRPEEAYFLIQLGTEKQAKALHAQAVDLVKNNSLQTWPVQIQELVRSSQDLEIIQVLSARSEVRQGINRVLIVDDEEGIRGIFKMAVEMWANGRALVIGEAANPQEALTKFQAAQDKGEPYELVWSDIEMKVAKNGIDLAKELKVIRPETQIVLASGNFQKFEAAVNPLLGKDVFMYLEKPFKLTLVHAVLNQVDKIVRSEVRTQLSDFEIVKLNELINRVWKLQHDFNATPQKNKSWIHAWERKLVRIGRELEGWQQLGYFEGRHLDLPLSRFVISMNMFSKRQTVGNLKAALEELIRMNYAKLLDDLPEPGSGPSRSEVRLSIDDELLQKIPSLASLGAKEIIIRDDEQQVAIPITIPTELQSDLEAREIVVELTRPIPPGLNLSQYPQAKPPWPLGFYLREQMKEIYKSDLTPEGYRKVYSLDLKRGSVLRAIPWGILRTAKNSVKLRDEILKLLEVLRPQAASPLLDNILDRFLGIVRLADRDEQNGLYANYSVVQEATLGEALSAILMREARDLSEVVGIRTALGKERREIKITRNDLGRLTPEAEAIPLETALLLTVSFSPRSEVRSNERELRRLFILLHDRRQTETIRRDAARDLGGQREAAQFAVGYLKEILKNPIERYPVRVAAAEALFRIDPAEKQTALDFLSKALRHKQPNVRQEAQVAFERLGLFENISKEESQVLQAGAPGNQEVNQIVQMLLDKKSLVRRKAAQWLGQNRDQLDIAIPALIKTLKDNDLYVRKAAAESLGELGLAAKAAESSLEKLISDSDPAVSKSAFEALEKIRRVDSDTLLQQLKNQDPSARGTAAQALGQLGLRAKPAIPLLIELLSDPDPFVRTQAARSLGQIKEEIETVSAALVFALGHEDYHLRIAAAQALGNLGPKAETAVPALKFLSEKDNDRYVRDAARAALKKIEVTEKNNNPIEKEIFGLLEELKSKDVFKRREAIAKLGKMGGEAKEAIPSLLQLQVLKDPDPVVRAKTAGIFGRTGRGNRNVVAALIAAAGDKVPSVRSQALLALGVLGDTSRETFFVLQKALEDSEKEVRQRAVESLGRIGGDSKETIPLLIVTLKDPSLLVRKMAGESLGTIGRQAAAVVPALAEALSDPNAGVRSSAAEALRKFAGRARKALPFLEKAWENETDARTKEILRTSIVYIQNDQGPRNQRRGERESRSEIRSGNALEIQNASPELRFPAALLLEFLEEYNISATVSLQTSENWQEIMIIPAWPSASTMLPILGFGLVKKNEEGRLSYSFDIKIPGRFIENPVTDPGKLAAQVADFFNQSISFMPRSEVRTKGREIFDSIVLGTAFAALYGLGAYFGALGFSMLGFVPFLVWYISRRLKDQAKLADAEKKFKNSPIPFHRLDTSGKIIEVNQGWLKTLGYEKEEEVIGKSILDFIVPEQRANAQARFNERLEFGEARTPKQGDRWYVKKDGARIIVQTSDAVERNAQGKAVDILTSFQDITQQRAAEEALRKSEELHRTLLASLPHSIFVKDLDSKFVMVNGRFAEEFGWKSPADLVGKTDYDLLARGKEQLTDEDKILAKKYRADDQEVMKSKRAMIFEETSVLKGQTSIVWVAKAPIIIDGEVTGLIGIFTDVTARKQAETELLRIERLSTMEETIRRVAHEIANPASNSALLLYDLMNRLRKGETVGQMELEKILLDLQHEVERISEITARTLGFLKPQSEKHPVYIENVVRDTLRFTQAALEDAGINVVLDLGHDSSVVIARKNRLIEAFLNLITNAKNAMKDSSRKQLTIQVRHGKNSEGKPVVRILFADTGRGISESTLVKLQRGERLSENPDQKGTGMGLANVREVIQEEHQGQVEIDSQTHVGSSFVVELPAFIPEIGPLQQKAALTQRTINRSLWHDMNNIIAGIIGYSYLALEQQFLAPEVFQILSEIKSRAEELNGLVSTAQNSKSETEKSKAVAEVVAFNDGRLSELIDLLKEHNHLGGDIYYPQVAESVEQVRRILQDVRAMKVDTSFVEKPAPLPVVETLQTLLNFFSNSKNFFRGNDIVLGKLEIPLVLKGRDVAVMVDRPAFLHALFNVVSLGMKHGMPSSVEIKNGHKVLNVKVDLNEREGEVILSFHNNYFRFSDEELKNAASDYGENSSAVLQWQGDASNDLAVSSRILAFHAGRIVIQSRQDGSDIRLFLPYYRQNGHLVNGTTETVKAAEEIFHPEPEKIIPGAKKVLVADDEKIQRDLFPKILAGYNVWKARYSQEAFDLIEAAQKAGEPFDLAILDVTMNPPAGVSNSIANGILLVRKLRKEGYKLPILISTGHAVYDEYSGLQDLVSGIIWKVSPPEEKLEMIEKIMGYQKMLEQRDTQTGQGDTQPGRAEVRSVQWPSELSRNRGDLPVYRHSLLLEDIKRGLVPGGPLKEINLFGTGIPLKEGNPVEAINKKLFDLMKQGGFYDYMWADDHSTLKISAFRLETTNGAKIDGAANGIVNGLLPAAAKPQMNGAVKEKESLDQHARSELRLTSIRPVLEVARSVSEKIIDSKRDWSVAQQLIELLLPQARAADPAAALSADASKVFELIRSAKEGIAPFAYVNDPANKIMTKQLFESADLIVGENQEGVNQVMLIVKDEKAVKILHEDWISFLKVHYAKDPVRIRKLDKNVHILAEGNRLISDWIPSGIKTAWVEWTGKEKQAVIPEVARGTQIYANQLKDNRLIPGFEERGGYGISLLQAALLLLKGPEESKLQKTIQGPYVQQAVATFQTLGKVFSQLISLRQISRSA